MASDTRQRQWQRQQSAQGLCIICGWPQAEGRGVYCEEHYEKRRQRLARRRQEDNDELKQKRCSVCGEYGHNKRSCTAEPKPPLKKVTEHKQHCSVCGQAGHNKRKCPHKEEVAESA